MKNFISKHDLHALRKYIKPLILEKLKNNHYYEIR
jgi:hypothetical protein